MLRFRLLYVTVLTSNVYDACVCVSVCVSVCVCVCVWFICIDWWRTRPADSVSVTIESQADLAQLSMFNTEKPYRNKIIITIIIIKVDKSMAANHHQIRGDISVLLAE